MDTAFVDQSVKGQVENIEYNCSRDVGKPTPGEWACRGRAGGMRRSRMPSSATLFAASDLKNATFPALEGLADEAFGFLRATGRVHDILRDD